MKKGLILLGLFLLFSCDLDKSLEKVKTTVDDFFKRDGSGAKTVSLQSIPSNDDEEKSVSTDEGKNLLIMDEKYANGGNVDILDEPNKGDGDFGGKDVISMTGETSFNKEYESDQQEKSASVPKKSRSEETYAKAFKPKKIEIRPLLLKGQYERAANLEVDVNDSKNRYYRAIATYNIARKTGSDKYAALADERFYELSNDKKMKNLRLRAVLWLGINGYSNLNHKKSIEEQLRPFDYLLKNYGSTRYANDAVFYKMLVYLKANEKDSAAKMWEKLKDFAEDDLIYDVNHSEWVSEGKILKRYGSLFDEPSKKRQETKEKQVSDFKKSAPSKSASPKRAKASFQLEELTPDQEQEISSNSKLKVAPQKASPSKKTDDELNLNYSDDEASRRILEGTRGDAKGLEALDRALAKDERDLLELENARSAESSKSDKTDKKEEGTASKELKLAKSLENERVPSDSNAAINQQEKKAEKFSAEGSDSNEKLAVKQEKEMGVSIEGMMKDMDAIISGY